MLAINSYGRGSGEGDCKDQTNKLDCKKFKMNFQIFKTLQQPKKTHKQAISSFAVQHL